MSSPKHIIHSHCEVCGRIQAGAYYKSDEHFDYYLCEEEDKNGVQHSFAVLNEGGEKAKSQNRNLKILALAITVKAGIEIGKKLPTHPTTETHHDVGHTTGIHDGGTDTGHSSPSFDANHTSLLDDVVDLISDGFRHLFH